MITFRGLICLVVPSSILGLSWFWWRWKRKVYTTYGIENELDVELVPVDTKDNHLYDMSNNRPTNSLNKAESEDIVISNIECVVDGDLYSAEMKNIRSICEKVPPIDLNDTTVIEGMVISEELSVEYEKPFELDTTECCNNTKGGINGIEEEEISVLFVDPEEFEIPDFESIDSGVVLPCEINGIEEEEISVLFVDPEECEIPDFESIDSGVVLPCEIGIIQLSVNCDQGDLDCTQFSPVNYDVSTFISGKRLRNPSSCGDSAIVEDYNSDTLSFTGSDSAIKSSEGEFSTPIKCKPADERSCDKGVYSQDNGRIHRDWYGSALGSTNFKERPDKPRHWGSMPVTDSDSDSECILKRTAKIGSVSLDKLSIQLGEELANVKLQRERKFSSGNNRFPRQNRRRDRRKPESRSPKKPITPKKPPQPKKNESSRKQRKKSNSCCSKKDIEKPWRNMETQSKCDDKVSAKREVVEYEFPDDMCGRLIGKSGRHISEFKESTGVDICIECELHGKNRVVSMTGVHSQIKRAEKLLNEKFNDNLKLVSYPDLLVVVNNLSPVSLNEGTELDVIVTAVIDVANFYVQVFHQDVDEKLTQLQMDLSCIYTTPRQKYVYLDKDLPKVDEYCVSFVDNTWCRLKILEVIPETRMVDAFFIDYGGHVSLSIDSIWKIRSDMLQFTPQAVLCVLHDVVPVEGDEFSYGANDIFYQLIGGNVLKAFVVSTENDVPSVQLSYFSEERSEMMSVSEQMHLWGLVIEKNIPLFMESHDKSSTGFVDKSLEVGGTQKYESNANLKSILNCSAPQFIFAS